MGLVRKPYEMNPVFIMNQQIFTNPNILNFSFSERERQKNVIQKRYI